MKPLPWQKAIVEDSTLVSVAQGWARQPTHAQIMKGGTTNRCWKITTECLQHFVWRPISISTDTFSVCRTNEYDVLVSLANAKFAPKIERNLPQGLLVEWFEGTPLTEVNLSESEHQRYLISALVQIHNFSSSCPSTTFDTVLRFDYHQTIEDYWRRLNPEHKTDELKSQYQSLNAISDSLRTLTESLGSDCLCHFDIGKYNLIKSKTGLKIIDWEYSAIASPVLDLTFCIANSQIDSKASVSLYCYQRELNSVKDWQTAVTLWMPHICFMIKLWYLLGYQLTNDIFYLAQSKVHL
ncbi:phosphotransferase [Vibrio rumoiensis]|uniref:Aminoglycoside phosphotransferase domain-containing protein n=1 Tax=Vibrio rumoiensis 1S-45 TaxID=1188252 RepID=A0A1E5DZS6_9VIBR|nr:phosphotransferase [Vibrio rumoiensis]OEF23533.1 hypothetical protein A1QC_11700 [Vibrio rumoiensis 1S-45]